MSLHSTADFGTGLSARITHVGFGTSKASGRGGFAGKAYAAFTIVLTNRAHRAIAVNTVQVTASYGSSATPAIDLQGKGSSMFAGSLAAGRSAQAVYQFLIPKSSRHDIDLTVWYRSGAPTVLFHGALR